MASKIPTRIKVMLRQRVTSAISVASLSDNTTIISPTMEHTDAANAKYGLINVFIIFFIVKKDLRLGEILPLVCYTLGLN
jgi:hypothetical protein